MDAPLPNGTLFELDDSAPGRYLYHQSELGEFVLTSDTVIHTFASWPSMQHITSRLSEPETEEFKSITYTIGGMMLFPGYMIDGKQTLNQQRGFHPQIRDRMDLTLECICRHYSGERSPLADTIERYRDFFALFDNFRGYVDFFLLQDLVTDDYAGVRFVMPFDDFAAPVVPRDVDAYREYRRLSIEFVEARNSRIGMGRVVA